MTRKVKMFFINIIFLLVIIYICINIVIYFSQRKLLYHPTENNYLDENSLNHKIEKIYIPSENKLLGWYFKKNENYKTLLFFHGNAGRLENRIYKLNHFPKLDLNYLIFAYRGFSGNNGKPTEEGIYKDSRAVINWLDSKGIKKKDIILYGESLGGAVAIEIAQDESYAGIILESPFTSMEKAAKIYYPYLPVKLLLKDKYKTDEKILNVNSPILVMHGEKDKIVPFHMGKKIFDLAKNPKYSFFSNDDDHMMDYNDLLIQILKSFVDNLK